jgi:hypothetical protein
LVARAQQVFEVDRGQLQSRLATVFEAEGLSAEEALCIAEGIIEEGSDSVMVYARLGVQKPEYTILRQRIESRCD